jgi:hypothetical protein
MRTDVYQKITDQIVAALETGVRPWHQPWNAEHSAGRITRPLRGNGVPYPGINVLMLWSAAIEKGYAAPIWMTFKQAIELKACVRKGEHGSLVVYADKIIRTETDQATGEEAERAIPFMKGYTVFNVEQIDGLPEHYYGKPEARTDSVQRIAHAEDFFAATGANVVHGGSRACYIPSTDNIHMPCIDFFHDAESYYAVRAHETTHYAAWRIMPRPTGNALCIRLSSAAGRHNLSRLGRLAVVRPPKVTRRGRQGDCRRASRSNGTPIHFCGRSISAGSLQRSRPVPGYCCRATDVVATTAIDPKRLFRCDPAIRLA